MRAIVNGQLVEVPEGSTINDLKHQIPEINNRDSLAKVSGSMAEIKGDTEPVEPGGKYRSIPPVEQG